MVYANSGIKGVKVISGQALDCTQVLQLKKKKGHLLCSNIELNVPI